MEKEIKLQILDAAMTLAYERLSTMKAEDMGGETVARLLDQLSSIGSLHERVMYPYQPVLPEDGQTEAPKYDGPEQSVPTADDTEPGGDTETAAPIPEAATTRAPADTEAPTKTLVQVRTILSELAGSTNIDLPAILGKVGASKLSEVDPAKYEDLLAAAHEAAKEA